VSLSGSGHETTSPAADSIESRDDSMTTFVRTCVVILFASFFVYGQESSQKPSMRAGNPGLAAIVQGPTVLATGDTWAVISWTTNIAGRGHSVIYTGTSKNHLQPANQTPQTAGTGNSDVVPSYQEQEYSHLVRVTNLKPGTTYYFTADSGQGSNHGVESRSGIAQFNTTGIKPPATMLARRTPAKHAAAPVASAALSNSTNNSKPPSDHAKLQNVQTPPSSSLE
jgi:hypothetical protein